jgi:hypothetical protein
MPGIDGEEIGIAYLSHADALFPLYDVNDDDLLIILLLSVFI